MNQNELREKLNDTIANGLMAKAIASKTKITTFLFTNPQITDKC